MERLDVFLVQNNFFSSRNKAQNEIKNGNIEVNGKVVRKTGYQVDEESKIKIVGSPLKYVSKGGLKLEKAIYEFHLDLRNKIMLDIGSSTGGFCDCALQHNIAYIYAVDVGKYQFTSSLLESKKISLYENTDIRDFDFNKKNISFVTIDVSFISVLKFLKVLKEVSSIKEVVCLIKPQFECGKMVADQYKGVVLDKKVHEEVIKRVVQGFSDIGFSLSSLTFSPIQGGSGNIEYLGYFTRKNKEKEVSYRKVIENALSSF